VEAALSRWKGAGWGGTGLRVGKVITDRKQDSRSA